jgi:hypothetical protein
MNAARFCTQDSLTAFFFFSIDAPARAMTSDLDASPARSP